MGLTLARTADTHGFHCLVGCGAARTICTSKFIANGCKLLHLQMHQVHLAPLRGVGRRPALKFLHRSTRSLQRLWSLATITGFTYQTIAA